MSVGYSYLMPGAVLAQGSAPPAGVRLPFDVIVLAAEEYQPDLPGYDSGYGQAVTDPTPNSRVGRWLAAHGYSSPIGAIVRPILIAGSLLFLASLAANYFQPGTVTLPKIQRALRI